MTGAISTGILSGLYIQYDMALNQSENFCIFTGYGLQGLSIAIIALSGSGVLLIVVGMLAAFFKKEDGMAFQLVLNAIAVLGFVCCAGILVGAQLGTIITANKNGDSDPIYLCANNRTDNIACMWLDTTE
jgi:hypothetical protein